MRSSKTLLTIDQGTTSSRAILFSTDGQVIGSRQKDLKLHTPRNGWVEQNPKDIIDDVVWCVRGLMNDHPEEAARIASLGITNQRETTIIWDRATGEPVYNAIVWQDRRGADLCDALKQRGVEDMILSKTGLLLDPYFSATKIAWILDHVPNARDRAARGDLAFGTVDCYVLWHLTGGKRHATDCTNASRTMLYNIQTGAWDDDLLKLFDIPRGILPDVLPNIADFGTTTDLIGKAIPIGGMAGDQQAALIGQACFEAGMVKSTYGTGCFALMNIGREFKLSKNRLLTTIAYDLGRGPCYAIEGSIFVAGAAIQWLRDGIHLFEKAGDTDAMAKSVSGNDGVYFIPAFTGLGAPFWRPEARGVICGLSRGTTAAHIVRAALEAQAYQTLDLFAAFAADGGYDPNVVRADGGLVANDFMCQFLSDMLEKPVEIPPNPETTASGAAMLAGLYAGVYKDEKDVSRRWSCARRYVPSMLPTHRQALYDGWKHAMGFLVG
jgi:glycerol kinase